jgi:transcription antitermination factor NusG
MSLQWYCIHTRPQKESHVAAHCRVTLGLEVYYPQLRETKTIRRVRRVVTGPLFPRYLFCRFDVGLTYRAVRYAPDAVDVVQAGNAPAEVSDGLIAELRAWAGEALDVISLRPALRPGDAVEITSGPLRGMPATIVQTDDAHRRVAILLSLLQTEAHSIVSLDDVRRVVA